MIKKTLHEIHEEVPADYYDTSIKTNLGQKIWHQARFRNITAILPQVNGKILDIGCHGGKFTEIIAQKTKAKEVYGIDISSSAIKFAHKRLPKFKFKVANAQDLPFPDRFFDGVTCLEVLEHVDYPEEVLSEIGRVLKRDGWAIILVPTENLLFKLLWFFWTVFGKGRVWRHAHIHNFSGNVLDRLLKQTGFRIEKDKYFLLKMLRVLRIRSK